MMGRRLYQISCVLLMGALYTGCATSSDGVDDRQDTAELGAAGSSSAFVLTVNTAFLGTIAVTSSDGTPQRVCFGSNCQFAYLAGASLGLTVVNPIDRADCIVFTGWSGACQGGVTPCTLVLDSDLTVTATWRAIPHCIVQ